jgi:hypothetical protein
MDNGLKSFVRVSVTANLLSTYTFLNKRRATRLGHQFLSAQNSIK